MARLTVKCSTRRYHDDDSSLAILSDGPRLGHMWETLADEIDGSSDVDVHYEVKIIEAERIEVSVKDLCSTISTSLRLTQTMEEA